MGRDPRLLLGEDLGAGLEGSADNVAVVYGDAALPGWADLEDELD